MAVVQTLLGFARQLVPFARRQPRPLKTVAVCLVCIVVSAGLFLVQPLMVRNALDVMFSEDASYSGLYWQCFLMLLNYVALHGVRQIGLFRQGVLAQQIVEDVRVLAFSEMISQGHVAVERRGVGAAQAMLTSDVTHLYTLIRNHATDMLNGLLFSVGGLLLCVAIQPFLTVFVVLLLAPMAFVMKQFDKIGKTAGKKIQESLSDTMDSVSEALMCTKEMDAYGTKAREIRALRMRSADHLAVVRQQLVSVHIFKGVGGVVGGSVIVGVILAGGHQALHGSLQASDLIAFVYLAVEIRNHATKLFDAITEALVAVSACSGVISLATVSVARVRSRSLQAHALGKRGRRDASDGATDIVDDNDDDEASMPPLLPVKNKPAVLIEDVTVAYQQFQHQDQGHQSAGTPTTVVALTDIRLRVDVGEVMAVVGTSGSGKTTLINLLMGFHDPMKGKLELFGHPVNATTIRGLRLNIGYVNQSPRLVRGTILDNIRYGQLDATDEECIAAAEAIGCDLFIRELESSWNTVLGRGVHLSGGQMARLSLARALVRRPRLLLLDEVTSALDAASEQLVLDGLFRYCESDKHVSAVIVTHKQHIAARCNRVCMLEHGRVVQMGEHRSLLASNQQYQKLWLSMKAQ